MRKAGERKPQPARVATVTVDYESVAQGFAALWFNTGTIVFGQDWQPDIPNREHIAVKDAIKRYVEAKQIPDMPPGLGLCIVLTTYTLARLHKPEVQTRLQKVWSTTKGAFTWAGSKLRSARWPTRESTSSFVAPR